MTQALVAVLVFASLWSGAEQKRQQPKTLMKVEVVHAEARRVENRIELDGSVRNAGDIPIEGLVLRFEFLSSALKPVATRNGPLSEKVLDPEEACSFSFALRDEPRAVRVRITAVDRHTDEPVVVAPGPYVIQ